MENDPKLISAPEDPKLISAPEDPVQEDPVQGEDLSKECDKCGHHLWDHYGDKNEICPKFASVSFQVMYNPEDFEYGELEDAFTRAIEEMGVCQGISLESEMEVEEDID